MIKSNVTGTKLEVIDSLEGLNKIAQLWQELEATTEYSRSAFQTYIWCKSWWDVYVVNGSFKAELYILIGYIDDTPAMIWPLMIVKEGACKKLTWISYPFSQYGDVIILDSSENLFLLDTALEFIHKNAPVDLLHFPKVRQGSLLFNCLENNNIPVIGTDKAPFINTKSFESAEAFLDARSKNNRKRSRYFRNKFAEINNSQIKILKNSELSNDIIKEIVGIKRKWLKDKASRSAILSDALYDEFMNKLFCNVADGFSFITILIYAESKLIAASILFQVRKSVFVYIAAYDVDYKEIGLGNINLEEMTKYAFETTTVDQIDLMTPSDAYKMKWTFDNSENVFDFATAKTIKGIMYNKIFLENRAFIKKVYYNLPGFIRKFLAKIID